MSNTSRLKPGLSVQVPWGVADTRKGTILEIWGDPDAPDHVLVELEELDPEVDSTPILMRPDLLTLAS